MKIALGWPCTNLGALLAQPQKNNDVQCLPSLPLPVSAGRLSYRQTYIKQVAEKHWCLRSVHMPVLAGRFSKGKPAISINLTLGVENKDEVGKRLWICLVSAPLTNCNVATCWHAELSTLNLLLLWLNIYLSNSFNSSIHVFHSKIDENSLGLALHESWGVACATTEKQWCPVSTESTFTCFRGKAFLGSVVAGWPGLDKGTLFIVLHVWKSHTHHLLSLFYNGDPSGMDANLVDYGPTSPNLPDSWAGAWLKVACPADTLNKSRHKPGQQGPNRRSISLAKRTAQLPSLNLVNRMCLSNSDFDVQSVGYKSAQSPTNWESIHGKDPSILCWLSSRLSMALSDENPKGEIQDCALTKETCNNHVHTMCVRNSENWPSTQLQFLRCECCKTPEIWFSRLIFDVCVNCS